MGLDTKTYWLTDRQSRCDFDFDLKWSQKSEEEPEYERIQEDQMFQFSFHPLLHTLRLSFGAGTIRQ
jgi:hypothetical protein